MNPGSKECWLIFDFYEEPLILFLKTKLKWFQFQFQFAIRWSLESSLGSSSSKKQNPHFGFGSNSKSDPILCNPKPNPMITFQLAPAQSLFFQTTFFFQKSWFQFLKTGISVPSWFWFLKNKELGSSLKPSSKYQTWFWFGF